VTGDAVSAQQIFGTEETRRYRDDDVDAVVKSLRGGSLSVVFGRQIIRFERDIARFVGTAHAVATSSGTAALDIALDVLDIGFGDEVVVPAYTFSATVQAVLRNLAIPAFADISATTWNVTAETVEAAMTPRTRAVLVAHMFGNPAEMGRIAELCRARGVALVEDCAQAIGASIGGVQVGAFGDVGCFSFNEIKNLTTGEGGMLTLAGAEQAALARLLRLYGTVDLVAVELGNKATMTEMEAALGRTQLKRLPDENAARREFGEALSARLRTLPGISPQSVPAGGVHVYSRYVLRIDPDSGVTRDQVTAALAAVGVAAKPVYAVPLYRQPVITQLADGTASRGFARSYVAAYGARSPLAEWTQRRLPVTEAFCAEQIGFIVPPGVTSAHADQIGEVIASVPASAAVGARA
jgi:perosamine synthetase